MLCCGDTRLPGTQNVEKSHSTVTSRWLTSTSATWKVAKVSSKRFPEAVHKGACLFSFGESYFGAAGTWPMTSDFDAWVRD